MNNRLSRKFGPWLITHFFEFWYFYIGAFLSLYFLHYFQSTIPELAKELGDLVGDGSLEEIEIIDFFILALAILFFRTSSRLLFFYPARVQQKLLRTELMQKIEATPPEKYKDFSEGQLFQTIYNDLNRIRGFTGFALLQLGNIIIAATIFIPKIRAFNEDFLIAFSPMLGCIVLFTIMIYFFQPYMVKGMDLYGEVQNFVIEAYDAKKTIKNYHSEKSFLNLFLEHSAKEMRVFFIATLGRNISFPMIKLGIGSSLIWGAYIVKSQNLSGSSLIYFSGFLFLILEPLMLMSWIGVVTSQGYAAWTRVKRLLNSIEQDDEVTFISGDQICTTEFDFWDTTVKLPIVEKKWNILTGDTGCGKSYLIEQFAKYLSSKNFSYTLVQQEPYLYNDTVKNNIFLGNDVTKEKLELAKKYLVEFSLDHIEDSIESLLDLEVGENGKKISGGQAKRIVLIRSLMAEVDYILWDDPFSSVDLILEKQILDLLKSEALLKEKTFILTSHRLSTVRACDQIILLNKEGMIEHGSNKLLSNETNEIGRYFAKQLV